MDGLQKVQWHGPINLDNRMSENVQNIHQSHKLTTKATEN